MKLALGILSVALLCSAAAVASADPAISTCQKMKLFRSHRVNVWSTSGHHHAILYKAGLAIDADGAFRAYHPDDQPGLDSLSHAGHPGNWWALVTDNNKKTGRPIVQGADDPAPGFYVSTTALYDPGNPNVRDPHRYVDAEEIPYIVLHPRALKFAHLGDFAIVVNLQNGKTSPAIVADQSAARFPIGEASIALAKALNINSDPRLGGQNRNVAYVIYPNSGNGKPRPLPEITANANRLFEAWGGLAQLKLCLPSE
jgi:hypothetical protein